METGDSTLFKLSRGDSSRRTSNYIVSEHNAKLKVPENIDYVIQNEQPDTSDKNSGWSETCRVCADKNDHIIPIFEGEGAEHDLCNKIDKYLPIQVSKSDTLPKQLCYHCAATILAWHDLLEGCIDAEKRLLLMEAELNEKERLEYVEVPSLDRLTEGNAAASEELVDDPEPLPTQEKELACSMEKIGETNEAVECPPSPESEERLSGSRDRASQNSGFTDFQKAYVNFFGCPKNDRRTKTEADEIIVRNDDKTNLRESCTEISTLVVSNEEIKTNGSTIIVRSSRCNKKSFQVANTTKKSDKRSITEKLDKTIVVEIPSLKSNVKIKMDDTDAKISRSKTKRTSNGPYTCDLCGKKFRLRDSLKTHARIHSGEKQFTCHICGKQFGQTGCLYYHLKHVHGGVKNHSCDICGRSFAMKTTMEDHRRSIHTGERPFVCDSCGKTFKTKSSLYIHSRIHTENYPHECKYCNKVFRWRQQLLGHLTIHTGEKNHSCDVCGKAFGVKNHLTRHKRTHSVEKPHACQQCGMSFGQKRYLTTHQRLKHR